MSKMNDSQFRNAWQLIRFNDDVVEKLKRNDDSLAVRAQYYSFHNFIYQRLENNVSKNNGCTCAWITRQNK